MDEDILSLIKSEKSGKTSEKVKEKKSIWLIFTIGEKRFAIPAETVKEILRDATVFPLPFVPAYIDGILNRYGDPYVVINPATLEKMVLKHLPDSMITEENIDTEESTSSPENADFISKLYFLDTKSGLEFAADDVDFYHQILTTYMNDDKRELLQKHYQEKDWANYRIVAHSIKGTSLTIGAPAVSEAAKSLEFAVKEERYDYIDKHHEEVLKMYGELLEKMRNALG